MTGSYESELLQMVRESDDRVHAVMKATEIITLFLRQPESFPTQSASYPPALD